MLNKSVIAICAVLLLSACGGSGTEFQSIGVDPTPTPSLEPTAEPTAEPTPEPTPEPTATPEPTPEPGSNYLANSDFELGSGDDFTSWTKQNGADTMTATTTEACSGRALQVVNAADGDYWSTQLISDEVTTVSGESYTVSMWIKAEATGGVVRFSTTGPGNTNYGPDHTIATTDWHQVSYTFTADATSTGLALDLGLSAATYSVDEVQWVAGNSPITGTCDAAPGGPVNLFSNGELEQGSGDDFTNWSKWNGAGMMTAATDVSCSGRSLRAEPTGGNEYDVQLVSDAVTTEVGTDYTVSMLIKAETTGGQVRFSTANGSSDQYQGLQAINSTDWQQVSWTFAANAASTRVALDLGAEAVNYNVDDIWMLEGTAPAETDCAAAPVNLLTNGGLEAGSGDDFTGWSKWNGAANLVATTTETYSGTRALQATGIDGNYYEVQFVSDAVTTVVGTQYTASMWIKGSVDGGIVRFSTNYPTASAQYGGDETIGTDWELVTWNFTAQETPTRLVLDLGASAATYYIDDISLTE